MPHLIVRGERPYFGTFFSEVEAAAVADLALLWNVIDKDGALSRQPALWFSLFAGQVLSFFPRAIGAGPPASLDGNLDLDLEKDSGLVERLQALRDPGELKEFVMGWAQAELPTVLEAHGYVVSPSATGVQPRQRRRDPAALPPGAVQSR